MWLCLFPALHWSLPLVLFHLILLSVLFGSWGCRRLTWLFRSSHSLEGHRTLLWLCFLVCILGGSMSFLWSCSSEGLSSVTFWASFLATRIPTPPPLLFVLGLWIHLYPLIDICSPLLSCVSVISAMDIFSVLRAASTLLILPLIPLTLMAAMVISLFFLIRGRRFFLGVVTLLFWSFLWLVGLLSLASVWFTLRIMVASFLSLCGVSSWELVVFVLVVVSGLLGCPLSLDDGAGCPLGVAELVGCLVAGLVGCLVAGLVGCLVEGLVGCLILAGLVGCLVAGLVGCLDMAGLIGYLTAGLVGCLMAGLVGCLVAGLVGCLMAGLVGCLMAGLVDCLTAGMVGCFIMAGLVGCRIMAGLVGCLMAVMAVTTRLDSWLTGGGRHCGDRTCWTYVETECWWISVRDGTHLIWKKATIQCQLHVSSPTVQKYLVEILFETEMYLQFPFILPTGCNYRVALKYDIYSLMAKKLIVSIHYVSIIDMDFFISIGNSTRIATEP